jgi:hypothetical protein
VKLNRNSGTAQAIRIGHVFFEEEIKTCAAEAWGADLHMADTWARSRKEKE